MKKIIFVLVSTIILVAMLAMAFEVRPVKATGTIYIRADGSIDPPTANITTTNGVTYTFTGNITSDADGILVERDSIVLDGAGYTLQGSGIGYGFGLTNIHNVTIQNAHIENFVLGVVVDGGSADNTITDSTIAHNLAGVELAIHSIHTTVRGNHITANIRGVRMWGASGNVISENNITANLEHGVDIDYSMSNTIRDNTVADNECGMFFNGAMTGSNVIFHNNFVNNTKQVEGYTSPLWGPDHWDNGYPSGGNYWSDYTDVDWYRGEHQNEPGSDGIWDHPYVIGENSRDRYPFIGPFGWLIPAGDVDRDFDVDLSDVVAVCSRYGCRTGDLTWNPYVDLAPRWGIIDIFDCVTVAYYYGKPSQ